MDAIIQQYFLVSRCKLCQTAHVSPCVDDLVLERLAVTESQEHIIVSENEHELKQESNYVVILPYKTDYKTIQCVLCGGKTA